MDIGIILNSGGNLIQLGVDVTTFAAVIAAAGLAVDWLAKVHCPTSLAEFLIMIFKPYQNW